MDLVKLNGKWFMILNSFKKNVVWMKTNFATQHLFLLKSQGVKSNFVNPKLKHMLSTW